MNKDRRKALQGIIDQLTELKEAVESLQEEEQEAFDNLPEGIQFSERGESMEEAISNLEDAVNSIDEAISSIESATE